MATKDESSIADIAKLVESKLVNCGFKDLDPDRKQRIHFALSRNIEFQGEKKMRNVEVPHKVKVQQVFNFIARHGIDDGGVQFLKLIAYFGPTGGLPKGGHYPIGG